MTEKPKVGFIGDGRVGKGLSLALRRAGYDVIGVAGRDLKEKDAIFHQSDLLFLTVPDDALSFTCEEFEWEESKSVVHCSGAAELSVLKHAEDQGSQVGGFHPLLMFADPEIAARGLKGCAIAIEAQAERAARIRRNAASLGVPGIEIQQG